MVKEFGVLSLSTVAKPALRYAKHGFKPSLRLQKALKSFFDKRLQYDSVAKQRFYDFKGNVKMLIKQPELAKTIEMFSIQGKKGFYQGAIAKTIVSENRLRGGIFQLKDLRHYEVKRRNLFMANILGFDGIALHHLALVERLSSKA